MSTDTTMQSALCVSIETPSRPCRRRRLEDRRHLVDRGVAGRPFSRKSGGECSLPRRAPWYPAAERLQVDRGGCGSKPRWPQLGDQMAADETHRHRRTTKGFVRSSSELTASL